jgi:hypothetical protein
MSDPIVIEGMLNIVRWGGCPGIIDLDNNSLLGVIDEHMQPTLYESTEHQSYSEYGRVRITIERLDGEA